MVKARRNNGYLLLRRHRRIAELEEQASSYAKEAVDLEQQYANKYALVQHVQKAYDTAVNAVALHERQLRVATDKANQLAARLDQARYSPPSAAPRRKRLAPPPVVSSLSS